MLKTIDDISLASDTLIIIECIVDVKRSYQVLVYNSNKQEAKAYKMEFDLQNYPKGKLNEISLLNKPMDILYSYQQGNIEEKIKEIKEIRIMPAPVYLITIGIKNNNKFEFEYYRIYPWDSTFPSGKWLP